MVGAFGPGGAGVAFVHPGGHGGGGGGVESADLRHGLQGPAGAGGPVGGQPVDAAGLGVGDVDVGFRQPAVQRHVPRHHAHRVAAGAVHVHAHGGGAAEVALHRGAGAGGLDQLDPLELRQHGADGVDGTGGEADDARARVVVETEVPEALAQDPLGPQARGHGVLGFDEQPGAGIGDGPLEEDVELEDRLRPLPGAGIEAADLRQRRRADRAGAFGGPAEGAVVHADQVAVGGEADVALDAVGPFGHRRFVGADGVLRVGARGTAVGDDLHQGFSS